MNTISYRDIWHAMITILSLPAHIIFKTNIGVSHFLLSYNKKRLDQIDGRQYITPLLSAILPITLGFIITLFGQPSINVLKYWGIFIVITSYIQLFWNTRKKIDKERSCLSWGDSRLQLLVNHWDSQSMANKITPIFNRITAIVNVFEQDDDQQSDYLECLIIYIVAMTLWLYSPIATFYFILVGISYYVKSAWVRSQKRLLERIVIEPLIKDKKVQPIIKNVEQPKTRGGAVASSRR